MINGNQQNFGRYILLVLLGLFFIITAQAQRVIVVDDLTKEFVFEGDYIKIYEDKEKKLDIGKVSTEAFDRKFKINTLSYPYNENIKSAYWIKFRVKNNSKRGKSFLLESYAPHTNNWDVYIPDGKGGFIQKKSGLNLNFYEREYVNKNLILDIPLDTGSIETFYVRVLSENHSSFDYRIKLSNYFFYYSVNEYYFLGIYYGIMLIMAIYNLLIYFSLREKVYIYYVLYVLSGILTSLSDDSIGNQYVWVNYPDFNTIIGAHIAPLCLLFTFILYARAFLRLGTKYPNYDKIVIWLTILYIAYYLLRLIFPSALMNLRGLYLVPFIAVYYFSIKVFLNGYKPARYVILGFGFILISIIIIKLRSNGSIEGNLFTVYSFNYGLVLEVLVLSFALAERVKFAKRAKEKALRERNEAQFRSIKQLRINEELKDKVNQELEGKVEERTKELHNKNAELEEANLKLKEMTDKANEMSRKLDVDNWNLQKKVLDSIRDRMIGQEVTYEEFNKLFANETACYRYLYELKWEESFVCRRCRGTECTSEEKLFSKKCVKCNYLESVTAHTLFHAIKFPITKAFYILYIMIYQQDRMTLTAMSDLLQLRKNTCWMFKQKILLSKEILEKKIKRKTGGPVNEWEAIIFVDQKKINQKKSG